MHGKIQEVTKMNSIHSVAVGSKLHTGIIS